MSIALRLTLFLILSAQLPSTLKAEVKLPGVFGDNMVLQRGQENQVWGKADPGEILSIAFAGMSVKTTAGQDGHWKAMLPNLMYSPALNQGATASLPCSFSANKVALVEWHEFKTEYRHLGLKGRDMSAQAKRSSSDCRPGKSIEKEWSLKGADSGCPTLSGIWMFRYPGRRSHTRFALG